MTTVQFYNYLAAVEVEPQPVATPTHKFTRARYTLIGAAPLPGQAIDYPGQILQIRDSWSLWKYCVCMHLLLRVMCVLMHVHVYVLVGVNVSVIILVRIHVCVAPPIVVGAWPMAGTLWQLFVFDDRQTCISKN